MSEPLQIVSPIRGGQPIVDKSGGPSPAFIRAFNQHFPNAQVVFTKAASAQATADKAVPQTRKINTTAPILGGGELTADLTLSHDVSGVTAGTYGDGTHIAQVTVDAKGHVTAVTSVAVTATGTVTTTGTPANGNLAKFSGASSITNGDLSGDVTTSGTLATTIANNAVTTAKINAAAVTLAKIQNASANSVLLGAGASGSGASYVEITLGTGLTMTGTTLSASGGGSGTVTTTGTPASGNLTKFSGSTSITNGDLSGDVTTSGTLATTIAANAVTFSKFVAATGAGFVGATAAGNYSHRTPTQVTAALDAMVGDSGSGGTKGLVPAPATGDASKFLKGDGTWGTPSGGGSFRGCLVNLSADQTTANYAGGAMVPFDAEQYDTDSIHDNSTNNTRLTVPSGVSKVKLSFGALISLVSSGSLVFGTLNKNGAVVLGGFNISYPASSLNQWNGAAESAVLSVAAGDYFELKLNTGADTSVTVTAAQTWFAMQIIA